MVVSVTMGCSSNHDASTTRVEGRITYRGEPVGRGVVHFVPLDGQDRKDLQPAAAALQADGAYRLSASRNVDGVLPGNYAVAVVAYRNPLALPGEKIEYAVPVKYANPHTSGLTATIPQDAGPLRLDFDLSD